MTNASTVLLLRDALGNQRFCELLTNMRPSVHCERFDCFEVTHSVQVPDLADALDAASEARQGRPTAIITSRHAASVCASLPQGRPMDFFVVGTQSAAIIQQAGVGEVLHCAGHAGELVDTICALPKHELMQRRFIYYRGKEVSADIASVLRRDGLDVSQIVVYSIDPIESELTRMQAFLACRQDAYVVPILSQRTAGIVTSAIFQHINAYAVCHAVAISAEVMSAVSAYPWASSSIAENSTLESVASACIQSIDGITDKYE